MNAELFLLVASGGALGAALRFLLSSCLRRLRPASFPLPTFLINLTGSFLLGLLIGSGASLLWQKLLGTGFLGGFTTFSTLHTESIQLLREGNAPVSIFYLGLSYFLCIAGAAAGMLLSLI